MARARRNTPEKAREKARAIRVELEVAGDQQHALARVLAGANQQREEQGLPPCASPSELFAIPLGEMVKQQLARQEQADALGFYRRWREAPRDVQAKVAELLRI